MLSCQQAVALIPEVWEGLASEDVRGEYVAHLSGCEDCKGFESQLIELLSVILKRLPAEPLAAEHDLLAALAAVPLRRAVALSPPIEAERRNS